jgi:tetratricopeptide (TPR) repeat protein
VASLVSTRRVETKHHQDQTAMSLVTHKYTPAEMSPQELESTFAAREHTVSFLLKSLRDQIHSGTLSSFVITGPRGAGKSTVIHMVALRIRQDAELSAAWIPVVFPEEQFNMISLRDMLAATLQMLARDHIPAAQEWLDKVEAEPNEEQSQQLAVTGLREVTHQSGKRLILFIENLNQLLDQHLEDQMKGTLRRLLMTGPVMMIIGSTVHVFDSLKRYDEAFFNYFGQVPLDRLNADQVSELLRKRAEYDGNEQFLRELPKQQAKIRTLVHLTGGNPRFVLMLYELLSLQHVATIVQYLRRLVDELTPLLKDEMENLAPQQRKIIHALMEKGGTAQPTDLTGPTRLPLNAITTQLKRLKDAQIVEVLGGGKGRAANYTVPDKLFSIWYQMRYLGQNRRRIELFVEVLRIWFAEEERVQTLRQLAGRAQTDAPYALRERATTAEYFAASLKGTIHERLAADLCVGSWVKADLQEAAIAYSDFSRTDASKRILNEATTHTAFAAWLSVHNNPQQAVETLDRVLAKPQLDASIHALALLLRGNSKGMLGDNQGAIADSTAVIELRDVSKMHIALALFTRGIGKAHTGDKQGAIADYTACVELDTAPKDIVVHARINRGNLKEEIGDTQSALVDYSAAVELKDAPKELVAEALIRRGLLKVEMDDNQGAIIDFTTAAKIEGISKEMVARALFNRGLCIDKSGDTKGAIKDYTAVIELEDAPKIGIAFALTNRGCARLRTGNMQDAIADWGAVVELEGAPKEQIARALFNRGVFFLRRNDLVKAVADLSRVIDLSIIDDDLLSDSASLAFSTLWTSKDQIGATRILTRLSVSLNSLVKEKAREVALRFLNGLASAEEKEAWPIALRSLVTNLKPEAAEAIRFLEPVCSVLEGKDRTLLDALPPEQREFALEVLAKFEPKPKTESAKSQKTSYRKRTRSSGSTVQSSVKTKAP